MNNNTSAEPSRIIPAEVQNVDFINVWMPDTFGRLHSSIIHSIQKVLVDGLKYVHAVQEYDNEVARDESQHEIKIRNINSDMELAELETLKAQMIKEGFGDRVLGAKLEELLQKAKHGIFLTDEDRQLLKELEQKSTKTKVSYGQMNSFKYSTESENDSLDNKKEFYRDFSGADFVNGDKGTPKFFGPVHESEENQKLYKRASENYFAENDKTPEFGKDLAGNTAYVNKMVEAVNQSARPKNKLAETGTSDIAVGVAASIMVTAVDASVWYFIGDQVLNFSPTGAIIIAGASVCIAKVAGEIMFKDALYERLKNGGSLSLIKGLPLIRAMVLITALCAGLAMFTSHKMKEDMREKRTEAMKSLIDSSLATSSETTIVHAPDLEPYPLLKMVNFWATLISQGLLGLLSVVIGGYLFVSTEILLRVYQKKVRVGKSRKIYMEAISTSRQLINGCGQVVLEAAKIAGLRAIYKKMDKNYG